MWAPAVRPAGLLSKIHIIDLVERESFPKDFLYLNSVFFCDH